MTNTINIPDEAVPQAAKLAAVKAYIEVDGKCRPVAMTAALTAALPHLSAPCAVEVKDLAILQRIAKYADEYDEPDENGAWPDMQDAMVTVGDLRALRRILSSVATKTVDVAAIEAKHDKEMAEVIKERDQCEAWADKLAYAIGGEAIGEHSNMNSPWSNALEMAESVKTVDVTVWAQDLLSTYDQFMCCKRSDADAKALVDKLIRAACFAGEAYEDAMSAPLPAHNAPAVLLRALLVALIDWKSPELDPYRAKNRPLVGTVTNEGTTSAEAAALAETGGKNGAE